MSQARILIDKFEQDQENLTKQLLDTEVKGQAFFKFRPYVKPSKSCPSINCIDEDKANVFLLDAEQSLIALGRKVPGFHGHAPENELQWYSITAVIKEGAKSPTEQVRLNVNMLVLWPKILAFEVWSGSQGVNVTEELFGEQPRNNEPKANQRDGQTLILLFQSKAQRELMRRNCERNKLMTVEQICLAPRANLVYYLLSLSDSSIALIVVQDIELKDNLTLALTWFQESNPGYEPSFIVMNEDRVIKECFTKTYSDASIMISETSRAKAWDDWFNSANLEDSIKKSLKTSVNKLADSKTMATYEVNLTETRELLKEIGDSSASVFWETWLQRSREWVSFFCPVLKLLSKFKPRYLNLQGDSPCSISHNEKCKVTRRQFSFFDVTSHFMKSETMSPQLKVVGKGENVNHNLLQQLAFMAYNSDNLSEEKAVQLQSKLASSVEDIIKDL